MPILLEISLDRRAVINHRNDDFAVERLAGLAHNNVVAVKDARLNHRIALDMEDKVFAFTQHNVRNRHILFQIFLRENRLTCRHAPDNRHGGGVVADKIRVARHFHRARFHRVTVKQTALFQPLKMPMHGGGGFQPDRLRNFAHGRRITFCLNFRLDKIEDALLIIATRSLHGENRRLAVLMRLL